MNPLTATHIPLKRMDSSMLVFELDRETRRLMPTGHGLVTSAGSMASYLHREQTRFVRGDLPRVPYIEHPLRVALRLLRWGVADADLIAAALLHDIVEDCGQELLAMYGHTGEEPLACLERLYGHRVARFVDAVTNPTDGTAYDEHIAHLAGTDSPALLIKASDLKDNAGSIRHQLGHGQDARMYRMLLKYLPAVEVVARGLRGSLRCLTGQACTLAAIADMEGLGRSLSALSAEHGID
jgi:(p)ppGpp synthase/HD superfamily hydrolase